MKKLSLVFIFLLMATIITLPACKKPSETEIPSDTTPYVTTEEEKTDIVILDSENSYYTIIRPERAESYEVTASVTLNSTLMNKYDDLWHRKLTDDFVKGKKNEIIENSEKEILIGYTNRKESRDVFETLEQDEYVICIVNEKIVIIGQNQYATNAAVEQFVQDYVTSATGTYLSVPLDLNVKGVCGLRKIPLYKNSEYRIMSYNLLGADGVVENAIKLITDHLPDVIGLQESNKAVHTSIIAKLPDFYKVANQFHSNGKTYNYTPIVYNSNVLTLKDSELAWLDGRYTLTNTKSIAWALFETQDGKQFAVINFHGAVCSASYQGFENMTSEQRNQQALTWRLDNVRQILEVRAKIEGKYGKIPILLTGDCNFNSSSEPYANLTAGGFEDSELTATKATTGYKTYAKYGTVTTAQAGLSIDHIFKVNGIKFERFDSVRDPIAFTASDHLPVYSDFALTN